jgi:hypothetical protein
VDDRSHEIVSELGSMFMSIYCMLLPESREIRAMVDRHSRPIFQEDLKPFLAWLFHPSSLDSGFMSLEYLIQLMIACKDVF